MTRTLRGVVVMVAWTMVSGCSGPGTTVTIDAGDNPDGSADGSFPDLGSDLGTDTGVPDAMTMDSGDPDMGADAGDPDVGTDAGDPDAGAPPCSPPTGAASPPYLDDVVAWYDSCDPGIVLGPSNEVLSWPARAGSAPALEPFDTGATAVQSTALGGRTMLFSTGMLRTTTATWNTVQNTIVVLVVPSATTGEDIVGSGDYWTPNDTLLMIYSGAVAGHFWPVDRFSGTQTYGTVAVSAAAPVVLTQVNDGVARTLSVFTNGVENGTNTWTDVAGATPLRPITVGRRCEVCVASETFTGEIAEVLIYDRPLTGSERVEAEDFLRSRFGLPSP